jgi:hypothetical protein
MAPIAVIGIHDRQGLALLDADLEGQEVASSRKGVIAP